MSTTTNTFDRFDSDINAANKALGKTLTLPNRSWPKAKASEVLAPREATFLPQTQRGISLKSIGGGTDTSFDNNNLYGFAIFDFTGGWDSGWNVVNVKTAFRDNFNVVGILTGGDDIANTVSYFFNINPKSISLSEPNAVHIVPTQNNGFYIESQGTIMRSLSISGTTGFRPNIQNIPTNSTTKEAKFVEGEEDTGFVNHIKLRNLFRNYSNMKKNAFKSHNAQMIWYNGRDQEAWFCEPESFSAMRDASSPFTTRYEISVRLLSKVAFSAVSVKLSPMTLGNQFYLESARLAAVLLSRDNLEQTMGSGVAGFAKGVNAVKDFADNVSDTIDKGNKLAQQAVAVGGAAVGTFIVMGAVIAAGAKSIAFSVKGASDSISNAMHSGATDPPGKFWNNIALDFQSTAIQLNRSYNALMWKTVEDASDSPMSNIREDNAYYSNYGGATNYKPEGEYAYMEATVPKNNNSAEMIIGNNNQNPASAPLFYAANKARYPYIKNIPANNTLTPGDKVYIPIPAGGVPENIETKIFPLTITLPFYQELLGRDIKIQSIETGSGQKSFNFAINDDGDLATIESDKNMTQAIYIKLNTERGELFSHPGFGLIDVVGMKSTLNLSFATNLAINDSLLSDGRIESISDLAIQIAGDVMSVKLNAHLIGNNSIVPVGFAKGG